MLVSAVLDPAALQPGSFTGPLQVQAAVEFALGLHRNGVLVVDADGVLRHSLLEAASSLGSQRGLHRVQTGIVEILKSDSRVVQVGRRLVDTRRHPAVRDLALALHQAVDTDAIITSNTTAGGLIGSSAGVVTFETYFESQYERERRGFAKGCVATAEAARAALLSRTVRLARWLRIYDKELGRHADARGIARFRQGIDLLLRIWRSDCKLLRDRPQVDIYTGVKPGASSGDISLQRTRLERELVEPLARGHNTEITLHLKDDPKGIFHARYIETPNGVVRVDPGMDFCRSVLRLILSVETDFGGVLLEIRNLRNA